jgi:hypothetical protein
MRESYREGVAHHPGPEPCEGGREAALEALDRSICRLGIELRNPAFRGPTSSGGTEGNNDAAKLMREMNKPAAIYAGSPRIDRRRITRSPARSEKPLDDGTFPAVSGSLAPRGLHPALVPCGAL